MKLACNARALVRHSRSSLCARRRRFLVLPPKRKAEEPDRDETDRDRSDVVHAAARVVVDAHSDHDHRAREPRERLRARARHPDEEDRRRAGERRREVVYQRVVEEGGACEHCADGDRRRERKGWPAEKRNGHREHGGNLEPQGLALRFVLHDRLHDREDDAEADRNPEPIRTRAHCLKVPGWCPQSLIPENDAKDRLRGRGRQILAHIESNPMRTLPVLLGCLVVAAFATAADTATNPVFNPRSFILRVTNPWFPLKPGTTWIYRGVKDGKTTRDVVTVVTQTR